MTTYNNEAVTKNAETTVPGPPASSREKYLADLDAREDALLRAGNGIIDDLVFPTLRDMGVTEEDLHRAAMRLVRYVQYGLDTSGAIARFLGVKRLSSPAHGTIPASKCADDPKGRTYDQLLADEPKRSTVFAHVNGRLRRVYPKAQLAAALDASGHEFLRRKSERPATNDAERKARQQQKLDRAVRVATLAAFAAAIPKAKLGVPEWIDLLVSIVIEEKGWQLEDVLPRHGFTGKRDDLKGNCEAIARKLVAKMNDAQKRAFVIDALVHAWAGPNADAGKRAVFAKVIAQLGVDAKAIEEQVRADFAEKAAGKPKPKPSKTASATPKRAVRPAAKVVRARA